MLRLIIISLLLLTSCNTITQKQNKKEELIKDKTHVYKVDTIFISKYKIDTVFISKIDTVFDHFTYSMIKNIDPKYKIVPKKIVLGEIDHINEGFIWKKDSVIIRQPYRDGAVYSKDSIRRVFVNSEEMKITRIMVKDLDLFEYFNNILLDYYYLDKLYFINSKYVLIQQPMAWCGNNGQYFVLVIDPKKKQVFEFFVDYNNPQKASSSILAP